MLLMHDMTKPVGSGAAVAAFFLWKVKVAAS
jgi:hypothetical protein